MSTPNERKSISHLSNIGRARYFCPKVLINSMKDMKKTDKHIGESLQDFYTKWVSFVDIPVCSTFMESSKNVKTVCCDMCFSNQNEEKVFSPYDANIHGVKKGSGCSCVSTVPVSYWTVHGWSSASGCRLPTHGCFEATDYKHRTFATRFELSESSYGKPILNDCKIEKQQNDDTISMNDRKAASTEPNHFTEGNASKDFSFVGSNSRLGSSRQDSTPISKEIWNKPKQHKEMVAKKVKRFHCPYCEVSCSNQGQLKGHIRKHTGERPHACSYDGCDRRFARNEELTRHKRIHTGVRPYLCEKCPKTFSRRDHLRKHQKTHLHPGCKKAFTCDLCQQGYSRADALKRHYNTFHSRTGAPN